MQELARSLGLRDWVRRKAFPFDVYCETIHEACGMLARHDPAQRVDPSQFDQIVLVVAVALDVEGALLDHVLEQRVSLPDDEAWVKILKAAAWMVLERWDSGRSA